MSQEKHHRKKKHHKKKSDEKNGERPQSRLFTEMDAKSVEVSGYTVGHGAPQTTVRIPDNVIPTGVVGVDESVKLPTPSSKAYNEQADIKPNTIFESKENRHLPPISQRHYPYEYYQPHPNQQYYNQFYQPYSNYYEQYSPSHHHHHHAHQHHHHQGHKHHHHPHHHHRHNTHKKEVETYDPRWWYMPVNSVHQPKQRQSSPEYRHYYSPPKWYESPSQQHVTLVRASESRPSHEKYSKCRCEVCNPSKDPPRGSKWITYT